MTIISHSIHTRRDICKVTPDSKVHGANIGPTWVLSAPVGPVLAPWNLLSGNLYNSEEKRTPICIRNSDSIEFQVGPLLSR